jgi:hypothetical protein
MTKPKRARHPGRRLRGAKHFDKGKAPLDQLPFEALFDVAQVMAFGEKKYGRNNWRSGMDWERLIGSTLRHIGKWQMKQTLDEESGLNHLAHATCCLLYLLTYQKLGLGKDDR